MQAKATKKCLADITATDVARPNGPPPHQAQDEKVAEAGREMRISGEARASRKD